MPETRRAAKRRKVQESPLLGVPSNSDIHLTPSVVHVILEYLDFASLINVGACNTALKRTVYEEAIVNHWKVLDFGTIRPEWSRRITDRQLSALLRRVNAREKCSTLRLGGCRQIQGSGLAPLRGSHALKEIDLRLIVPENSDDSLFDHVEVDYDIVLPILESMAPFPSAYEGAENTSHQALGLSMVKFHREDPDSDNQYFAHSERLADWLRSYHEVLRERMIECRTCCDFCKNAIADKHSFEQMWYEAQSAYCEVCHCYSCRVDECPLPIVCLKCGLQCCQFCEDEKHTEIFVCDGCHLSCCEDCDMARQYCVSDNDCGMDVVCSRCTDFAMDSCPYCFDPKVSSIPEERDDTFCIDCFEEHKRTCVKNPKNRKQRYPSRRRGSVN